MSDRQEQGTSTLPLSKNALYTPLVAYSQTTVEPSKYASERFSKIPKSVMETSLTEFLQDVSQTYHRKIAQGQDPKNNGSRPQSLSDVDGSIRSKAVTLIGDGIHASIARSTNNNNDDSNPRKRKRRTKSFHQVQSNLLRYHKTHLNDSSLLDDGSTATKRKDATMNEIIFVKQLNQCWNDYVSTIMKLNDRSIIDEVDDERNMNQIKLLFSSSLEKNKSEIELLGAKIWIPRCRQKQNLVGKFAIIVGETKNTWKVWMIMTMINKKSSAAPIKNNYSSSSSSGMQADNKSPEEETAEKKKIKKEKTKRRKAASVILPKSGTSIDILIPIIEPGIRGTLAEEEEDDDDDDTGCVENMNLPSSATRHVCIKLES